MVEKCGWLTALCLPVGLQYEKGGSDKLASFSVKKIPAEAAVFGHYGWAESNRRYRKPMGLGTQCWCYNAW